PALLQFVVKSAIAVESEQGLPSPPPSPRMGEKERERANGQSRQRAQAQAQVHQHALLATLASQTVLQKMGQAFWDAFSGGSAPQVHASVSSTSAAGGAYAAYVALVGRGQAYCGRGWVGGADERDVAWLWCGPVVAYEGGEEGPVEQDELQ
ncbi:hypothetical protein EW145_g8508, partial [Phellinidium pouzarii]